MNVLLIFLPLLALAVVIIQEFLRDRVRRFPTALLYPRITTPQFIFSSAGSFLSTIYVFGGYVTLTSAHGGIFMLVVFGSWGLCILAALWILVSRRVAGAIRPLRVRGICLSPAPLLGRTPNERTFISRTMMVYSYLMIIVELLFLTLWLKVIYSPIGVSAWPTIILACFAVSTYSTVGGYSAVLRTDRYQAIIVIALLTSVAAAQMAELGISEALDRLTDRGGSSEAAIPGLSDVPLSFLMFGIVVLTFTRVLIAPDTWLRTRLWLRAQDDLRRARRRATYTAPLIALLFSFGLLFALTLSVAAPDYKLTPPPTADLQMLAVFEWYDEAIHNTAYPLWTTAPLAMVVVFMAMSTMDTLNATIAQLGVERRLFRRERDRNRLLDRGSARRKLRHGASMSLAVTPMTAVVATMALFAALGDLGALRAISVLFVLAFGMLTAYAAVFAQVMFWDASSGGKILSSAWTWRLVFLPAVFVAAALLIPPLGAKIDGVAGGDDWRSLALVYCIVLQILVSAVILVSTGRRPPALTVETSAR